MDEVMCKVQSTALQVEVMRLGAMPLWMGMVSPLTERDRREHPCLYGPGVRSAQVSVHKNGREPGHPASTLRTPRRVGQPAGATRSRGQEGLPYRRAQRSVRPACPRYFPLCRTCLLTRSGKRVPAPRGLSRTFLKRSLLASVPVLVSSVLLIGQTLE